MGLGGKENDPQKKVQDHVKCTISMKYTIMIETILTTELKVLSHSLSLKTYLNPKLYPDIWENYES